MLICKRTEQQNLSEQLAFILNIKYLGIFVSFTLSRLVFITIENNEYKINEDAFKESFIYISIVVTVSSLLLSGKLD